MTPRENFIHFLRGEPYDWVPSNLDILQFRPAFIPDHVARGFVAQQNPYSGPYGGADLLGVEWVHQPEAGGSMEKAPLFDDIEAWEYYVAFPSLDAMDWEGCAAENADYLNTDKLIATTLYTGYFERLISFVGFENAAMALIDEEQQESVERLFECLTDFYIDYIIRLRVHFGVDMVEIHDDWGTQINTMFSPETHRELILPHLSRLVNAAHDAGVFIEQHSCGKIDKLVPNIIESGVDTWKGQPIVDAQDLVQKYGSIFNFGITLLLDSPLDDAEVIAAIDAQLDKYKGKSVWLGIFGKALAPHQRQLAAEYLRTKKPL